MAYELAALTIKLLATEDGGMSVEVEAEGEPTVILALGMLEMAKAWVFDEADEDEDYL